MFCDFDFMEMFKHDILSCTNDLFYTDCFLKNENMGEVYIAFAKLPTAGDKFLYTYNLLKKYNKLPMECKLTNPKNNKKARKIREDANVKFRNKDYISAFCEYNKSVITAKIDSEDYVLAVANRSAALYYLEEYEDCIHDIHQALAKRYPTELAYKLYEREVKCLKLIGKTSQAKLKFKASIPDNNKSYNTKHFFFFRNFCYIYLEPCYLKKRKKILKCKLKGF